MDIQRALNHLKHGRAGDYVESDKYKITRVSSGVNSFPICHILNKLTGEFYYTTETDKIKNTLLIMTRE